MEVEESPAAVIAAVAAAEVANQRSQLRVTPIPIFAQIFLFLRLSKSSFPT